MKKKKALYKIKNFLKSYYTFSMISGLSDASEEHLENYPGLSFINSSQIIIPKEIAIEGIGSIMFKSKPFYKLYVHQHGLLRSNMAGSFPVSYYDEFSKLTVTHEILELLDYAGGKCIDNKNYEYDMCRQNYIFQVLYMIWILHT